MAPIDGVLLPLQCPPTKRTPVGTNKFGRGAGGVEPSVGIPIPHDILMAALKGISGGFAE